MRAALYRRFREPLVIAQVDDPKPTEAGVVLEVRATGICRSDWHGWMGHDADVRVPHVPGHEMAGIVVATGRDVRRWSGGERVTLPFVCGCGRCVQCRGGNQQVCDRQFQPGFTHWGSYAEYVAIDHADANLVRLPDDLDFVTAASLGCRFATAFRAVADQGRVGAGQWMAVFGCGGVGLSAVMIAAALGARVVAVDIEPAALDLARELGADEAVDAGGDASPGETVRAVTGGGAHVSLDAFGGAAACFQSIAALRKRGRHVQVGLLTGAERHPPVPMDLVVARELELVGSHGMQAHRYDRMLRMITAGRLRPERLVTRTCTLDEAIGYFAREPRFLAGVGVIDRFGGIAA